jgi:hypothetical protein
MTKHDEQWNMNYEKLVQFKRTNGHCVVPFKCQQDKSLRQWFNKQRNSHNNKKLRQDREELLDEIGFAWKAEGATNTNDKLWQQQHEKLVEFKRKKGHCVVPHRYEQDKSLGLWVNKQRRNHVNDKLRLDRKKILDEIGFVWKVDDDDKLWHQQCEKLVEFQRKKGHCMVPHKYEQDKSLGQWVDKQRRNHVKNKMRLDRKSLLDEIGFVWKVVADRARASTTDVRVLVIG